MNVLVISHDSEAYEALARRLADPRTYKLSIEIRDNGLAIKANESMWSPTLDSKGGE